MSSRAANSTLSARIRAARLAAELTPEEKASRTARQTGPLTQEELARRMGIRRDNLNKMENGGSVGEVNARRLARALGGKPEDWLESKNTRIGLQREIDELRQRIGELEEALSSSAGSAPQSRGDDPA